MDDIGQDREMNVRAKSYCIASSTAVCPHCGGNTRVVGLLLPPGGHLTRSPHEDAVGATESGSRLDSWERAAWHALLFQVEFLPDAVRQRMQRIAPMFRIAVDADADAGAEESHWSNHCERCGGIQEDHDLFCEPEGAFVPIDPDQGAAIELVLIEEGFEACAGGYAPDPEFIRFPSEA